VSKAPSLESSASGNPSQTQSSPRGRGAWRWAVVVAGSLVLGLVVGSAASGAGGLRSDIASLRANLGSLADNMSAALATNTTLQETNTILQNQNGQLQSQGDDLQAQVDALAKANAKRSLPKLSGKTQDAAAAVADKYGWALRVKQEESAKPVGTVLSQKPPTGTVMHLGAVITIVVAKPLPPKMPNLIGQTQKDAEGVAKANGWNLTVKKEVSSEAPGTIISQTPVAGTFMRGAASFTVVVAKKPPDTGGGGGGGDNCTPGYSPCLPPASDYDCAGGSGNGPEYVYGVVQVTGSDPYGLDSDGDGLGCE
jgi:hypothetical protein